jgi:hypothetical protein
MDEGSRQHQKHTDSDRSVRLRQPWIWVVGALIVMVGIGAAMMLAPPSKTSKVPAAFLSAQKSIAFTLYYPDPPPAGFSCNPGSVSAGSHAVLFTCQYDNGKKSASISTQARSPQVTTDQFRPTSEFTTRIGRAYMVDLEDRTTAAIFGKNSWVLINAPETMSAEDMHGLIDSLRPVAQ